MARTPDYMQLIKAFGRQDYRITDSKYADQILEHPVIHGLWASGNFFLFVGDTSTWKAELVTGKTLEITGFTPEEIQTLGPEFWVRFSREDHLPFNFRVIQRAMEYLHERPEEERPGIHVVYFYKAVRKNGSMLTVQHQSIPIRFDHQMIPYLFANIVTDISFLGEIDLPQATLRNHHTNEVFHLRESDDQFLNTQLTFTSRESEIIPLLLRGLSSRQIAAKLFISYETVRTHRKNILRKAGVKNLSQLISFVHRFGLAGQIPKKS